MVLLVESSLDSFSNTDEIIDKSLVGNVGVKVVLEVLEVVHTLLNIFISSNSWERPGTIVHLPGFNCRWLSSNLPGNFHCVTVMLLIKGSREHLHFVLHAWLSHN